MRRLQPSDPVSYRVKVGLNYGETRREPGEIVSDLPPDDIAGLLDQGAIELAEEGGVE